MATAALFVCVAVSGCSLSGKGLRDTQPDPLATASNPSPAPQDNDLASDRLTVQNAVSSADMNSAPVNALSWANSQTGSNGVVTAISEVAEGDTRCRKFQTTRTSYSGIAIHEGEVCAGDDGLWWTKQFKPI